MVHFPAVAGTVVGGGVVVGGEVPGTVVPGEAVVGADDVEEAAGPVRARGGEPPARTDTMNAREKAAAKNFLTGSDDGSEPARPIGLKDPPGVDLRRS